MNPRLVLIERKSDSFIPSTACWRCWDDVLTSHKLNFPFLCRGRAVNCKPEPQVRGDQSEAACGSADQWQGRLLTSPHCPAWPRSRVIRTHNSGLNSKSVIWPLKRKEISVHIEILILVSSRKLSASSWLKLVVYDTLDFLGSLIRMSEWVLWLLSLKSGAWTFVKHSP